MAAVIALEATKDKANIKPILAPINAMALVRTWSRV